MKKRKAKKLEAKKLGLHCGKCRTFIPADVWAVAHAHVELVTTCPKCGNEVTGRVR